MTPKSELRCILFPLILLEMFLQLNWSPPVINSIDWTWLGIANTCLYKVPQLTVHVRANSKPWGQRNYLQTSETGLCQDIDLENGTEKSLLLSRSQRAQWPPSFVNGRCLKPPSIFLDLASGHPAKLSNQGRRALAREVSRNLRVTLTELQPILVHSDVRWGSWLVRHWFFQSQIYKYINPIEYLRSPFNWQLSHWLLVVFHISILYTHIGKVHTVGSC